MVFGRSKAKPKSAPTEVVDLTPNVRVALWNVGNSPGREHPIHLSFERIAADGKSRRTLIPATLLDLPQALGVTCSALAKSTLPEPLRQSLKRLSDEMFRVAQEIDRPEGDAALTNGETIFG